MSDDWTNDPEWEQFVAHVREHSIRGIAGSGAIVSIVPPGENLDIKYCVELGASIMLDKPIVILVMPGRPIPERLRRVADEVVEADIDTEEGKQLMTEALQRLGLIE